MEGYTGYASGYPGACGFFSGDGENTAGVGLRNSRNQWRRRGTGTHEDALESFGNLSDSGLFIYQQDGSEGYGSAAAF